MIGVLDYGFGNLRSVTNAVAEVGHKAVAIATAEEVFSADRLIVPGVGSFGAAMRALGARNLTEPLRAYARAGKPLLGICLGMHVLAERGLEGGEMEGLGLISGSVRRLAASGGQRLPHVGWNTVEFERAHPLFRDIKPNRDFYFVHSYAFSETESEFCLGKTEYGGWFPSIVGRASVVGVQFHPEKSQINGLRLLSAFCRWDGEC